MEMNRSFVLTFTILLYTISKRVDCLRSVNYNATNLIHKELNDALQPGSDFHKEWLDRYYEELLVSVHTVYEAEASLQILHASLEAYNIHICIPFQDFATNRNENDFVIKQNGVAFAKTPEKIKDLIDIYVDLHQTNTAKFGDLLTIVKQDWAHYMPDTDLVTIWDVTKLMHPLQHKQEKNEDDKYVAIFQNADKIFAFATCTRSANDKSKFYVQGTSTPMKNMAVVERGMLMFLHDCLAKGKWQTSPRLFCGEENKSMLFWHFIEIEKIIKDDRITLFKEKGHWNADITVRAISTWCIVHRVMGKEYVAVVEVTEPNEKDGKLNNGIRTSYELVSSPDSTLNLYMQNFAEESDLFDMLRTYFDVFDKPPVHFNKPSISTIKEFEIKAPLSNNIQTLIYILDMLAQSGYGKNHKRNFSYIRHPLAVAKFILEEGRDLKATILEHIFLFYAVTEGAYTVFDVETVFGKDMATTLKVALYNIRFREKIVSESLPNAENYFVENLKLTWNGIFGMSKTRMSVSTALEQKIRNANSKLDFTKTKNILFKKAFQIDDNAYAIYETDDSVFQFFSIRFNMKEPENKRTLFLELCGNEFDTLEYIEGIHTDVSFFRKSLQELYRKEPESLDLDNAIKLLTCIDFIVKRVSPEDVSIKVEDNMVGAALHLVHDGGIVKVDLEIAGILYNSVQGCVDFTDFKELFGEKVTQILSKAWGKNDNTTMVTVATQNSLKGCGEAVTILLSKLLYQLRSSSSLLVDTKPNIEHFLSTYSVPKLKTEQSIANTKLIGLLQIQLQAYTS